MAADLPSLVFSTPEMIDSLTAFSTAGLMQVYIPLAAKRHEANDIRSRQLQ
jgi:hypothetical protein